jgi:thiol-disulfide isomerase/thioredoxin
MAERLLIASLLIAAGAAAWRLFTRGQLARAAKLGAARDPLLTGVPDGVATILYFTTPTCAPCRLQQTPALERLKGELGDAVHVVRVDATEQPDAASRWGVVSVPTLFVLGRDGAARHVHNGVVSDHILKQELVTA